MTTTVLAYLPSPSQGVWHLFGVLPIRAYALCIIVGIIAALVIGDRRWTARGGEQGIIYDVALWAVPFGLIGGRLYHVMTDWPKYFGADGAGFLAALRIWDGGLGIWGAVALGGVGAWIACRRRGIPLPAFGDAIAPGIILAQAIGRLGNYFNQELYGRPTDLPWGLTIYERLDPSGVISPHSLDGVSTGQVYAVVHPTFLYELLWNLLIFAVLIWVDRRFSIGHGRLFALYVAGYCVGRFWVELMRSDTATLIAGIRVNTFTSMFVFIAAVVYIMVAPKGREDPATLRGNPRGDEPAVGAAGKDASDVAATSGVLAAATADGDEDGDQVQKDPDPDAARPDTPGIAVEGTEVAEALQASAQPQSDETAAETADESEPVAVAEDSVGGLGAVEGDDAAAAEDSAAEVHDTAVQGAADAESTAHEVAAEPETGDEVAADPETGDEVAAEPETETADVPETETESEPVAVVEDSVGGLGAVEGDDAAAAEDSAAEVHDTAVEGAADAESTADEVAAEPETADESEPVAVAEDSVGGLGAVEGDDAAAAEDSAAEVHDTAVQGAADAESTADEVAAEPENETADVPETGTESEPVAVVEDSVGGLGAVESDDAAAAEDSAAEVHDTAVQGAADAESTADEVAAEPETETADETQSEPVAVAEDSVGGLGAVEGDDAAAAEDSAAEVHDTAVQGAADAESTADEVAAAEPTVPKTPDVEPPRRQWWRRS